MTVTTTSRDARALEGFVAVGDVVALAAAKGVASVSAALRPYRNAGAATSQGVVAERVDRLPRGVDGLGITVGVLSDSYDTATTDLFGGRDPHARRRGRPYRRPPGPGNPRNPNPVTVLEDWPGIDEGRAMLQIVHDVAPKAKQCFATAFNGVLGFADNMRALAARAVRAAPMSSSTTSSTSPSRCSATA